MTDLLDGMVSSGALSRPEQVALVIGRMAEDAAPGSRLGTKKELQDRCRVSKGTFNEAVQLLLARGLVTSRSGPGGGLFASKPNPFVRLGNSILALDTAHTDVERAVRLRDALDPLLVEDAVMHGAAADIARMRMSLQEMRNSIDSGDPTAFTRANWDLHAAIARTSPDMVTRTLYLNLLDFIGTHTVSVKGAEGKSLPDYIAERYALHAELVDALDRRDRTAALQLISRHRIGTTQIANSEFGRSEG